MTKLRSAWSTALKNPYVLYDKSYKYWNNNEWNQKLDDHSGLFGFKAAKNYFDTNPIIKSKFSDQ